ncbi:MAG: orotidine-5'-phosphate decarboxylase [Acetobacterales bacterium]
MTAADPASRIFCAIDTPDRERALKVAHAIAGSVGGIKLGKEFFMANGPEGVERVMREAGGGRKLFLDLKLHDIPNTVAGAVRSVARLAPDFLTVHAGGGEAMLRAAVDAARLAAVEQGVPRIRILGVTVLTSLSSEDLESVGMDPDMDSAVRRLALLAQSAGCDGVICSPHEIRLLRAACGPEFVLMVPGIRPAWSEAGDQKRVTTPAEALERGADYLVIGRPIAAADDPGRAARHIVQEIAGTTS